MFGFETIGNATVIAYDDVPILATDPWICGDPYFGSWSLSHSIPSDQLHHIRTSKYLWFSHGHPDHLNSDSLDKLSDRTILLPDHVGGRIAESLAKSGLTVQVLPSQEWVQLSPRIRVMCLPDYNQDATLLIAMGTNLIVNFNDSSALGYKSYLREVAQTFKRRYLLALRNYGDADMINIWDDKGNFLHPPASEKPSVGKMYVELAETYRGTHVIPFSCFHQYQRDDSIWTSKYVTPLSAHYEGFTGSSAELLPAFVAVDFDKDTVTELEPNPLPVIVRAPLDFGDNWSDPLEKEEVVLCENYFKPKSHVVKTLGFVNLRVGGRDNFIRLDGKKKRGITFECPRNSLVEAIKWRIFDDLLIGNFMKTTLHDIHGLYPDFSPYVAKYADNGLAQSEKEIKQYFRTYRDRSSSGFVMAQLKQKAEGVFRHLISSQSPVFKISKKVYHWF